MVHVTNAAAEEVECVLICRVIAEQPLESGGDDNGETTSASSVEEETTWKAWKAKKVRKTQKRHGERCGMGMGIRLPLDVKRSDIHRPRWSHRDAYDSSDDGCVTSDDEDPYTQDISTMWSFL